MAARHRLSPHPPPVTPCPPPIFSPNHFPIPGGGGEQEDARSVLYMQVKDATMGAFESLNTLGDRILARA